MITNEGWNDNADAIKYAYISWSEMTEEQKEAEVDKLGTAYDTHKLHCSVLAEESIKSAIKNYYDRNGIEYDHSRFPDDCGEVESCRMV